MFGNINRLYRPSNPAAVRLLLVALISDEDTSQNSINKYQQDYFQLRVGQFPHLSLKLPALTSSTNHTYVKAGANEEVLLQKQNCTQRGKTFLEKLRSIFCFQNRDLVFSTCVAYIGAQTRKQFENVDFECFPDVSSFAYPHNIC